MKLFLTVLTMFFLFSSCKNKTEKDVREQEISLEENSESENHPNKDKQNNASSKQKDSSEPKSETEELNSENKSTAITAGNYLKAGQESDTNCSCYCMDLQFNSTSELCLTPDKMYINVRFENVNENLVQVYLIAPSDRNTEGDDIPWVKFDTNTPIAAITSKNNGKIDFDWLGFTINGDLAQDYALFGKKTLEGTYKIK